MPDPIRIPPMTRWRIGWARLRRWEFWPAPLFYLPIVCYIIWLALRFRSASAFTATNPGMDEGGVVGERKSAMLLALSAHCQQSIPRTELLPASAPLAARLATAQRFVDDCGLPVVLKPDIGQRGRGVAIIDCWAGLSSYLEAADFDVLIQKFEPGAEFGVFVYRDPRNQHLGILSVTEKQLPQVVGDGVSTLAELILAQPRTRLIADLLFERHRLRLRQVLAVGARQSLVDVGSHCRGAVFLDGRRLVSAALRARLDEITTPLLPGFHFGRLDIIAPDGEQLRAGRQLKILEVNGVTSESAHVYHPGASLFAAYRAFFRQWWLAFAIGQANMRRGAHTVSPLRLLILWWADLRRFDGAQSAADRARASMRVQPADHEEKTCTD